MKYRIYGVIRFKTIYSCALLFLLQGLEPLGKVVEVCKRAQGLQFFKRFR
jgi:hypothetical protein